MTDHDIEELVGRLLGSVDAIKFSEHVPILFADEMAEAAQALTTLQAERARLREVVAFFDQELGPADDWTEKRAALEGWVASAFLAGERVKDAEWHKAELRSFLLSLFGYFIVAHESATKAHQALKDRAG